MLKSEPKNKQILILYNDEKIRTKSVASFKDLVKFMFGVVNFEYKDSVPLDVETRSTDVIPGLTLRLRTQNSMSTRYPMKTNSRFALTHLLT